MKDENVAGVTSQDWLHYTDCLSKLRNTKLQFDYLFFVGFTEIVGEKKYDSK